MCGVAALLLADTDSNEAAYELHECLGVLQHRGQDAAGIITCGAKGRVFQRKGNGMVREVFAESNIQKLLGYMGVAHVRYPTAGTNSNSESQPFYVNSPYGVIFAHNGNLTNDEELSEYLDQVAHRHINTNSDTELMLNIFAHYLNTFDKRRINEQDIFRAVTEVNRRCRGAYACTIMIAGFGIIGFRDPRGIRPLIYGRRSSSSTVGRQDFLIASESVALDVLGYQDAENIHPGECVIMTKEGQMYSRVCVEGGKSEAVPSLFPCMFELVYFARPDSIIDGISVYTARLAMGEALARRVASRNIEVDVVIPIPDTSRVAALQLSYALGIIYREGFMKNRYIGRTFIMPAQSQRAKSVRRKLNPISSEFLGKSVLLVDDSIVRGTTAKGIIGMAREAGAKKVYLASCSPPIRFPNVYGIDMPAAEELIANGRSEDEIASEIGVNGVIFQDLNDLVAVCKSCNPSVDGFDVSVFTGDYVTRDVSQEYLRRLSQKRRGGRKVKVKAGNASGVASTEACQLRDRRPPAIGQGDVSTGYESDEAQTVGLHNQKEFRK